MPSFNSLFAVAGFVALASAQAYTPPQAQTWGPVNAPNVGSPVTRGVPYTVVWDPENRPVDGVTISLVLCKGPSTNCVTEPTAIATGLAASAKSYTWNVPCSLTPGEANTATGYGLLAIVDGTGEFQYSTQFSVLAGSCSGVTTTTTTTTTTSGATVTLPTGTTSSTSDEPFSFTFGGDDTTSSTWSGWTKTFATSPGAITSKPSNGTSTSYAATSTTPAYSTTRPASTTTAQPTFTGAANKLAGAGAAILAAGAALLAL